jgi:GNAT superfamily N-acetyltransferase
MGAVKQKNSRLQWHAVTRSRWNDFEQLFGERGACGGCWCMAWRLRPAEWKAGKGSDNRRKMRSLISRGRVPGILAYDRGRPIGWCSVSPRSDFVALRRSRVLAPIDETPVWSISCLFVAKEYRRQGISVELLRAAASYARNQGALILEGYPVVPYVDRMPDAFVWTGTVAAFTKAGFVEVEKRSRSRPIFRRYLVQNRRGSM